MHLRIHVLTPVLQETFAAISLRCGLDADTEWLTLQTRK